MSENHLGGAAPYCLRAAAVAVFGLFSQAGHAADAAEKQLSTVKVGADSVIEEARQASQLGNLSMDKPISGTVLYSDDIETVKTGGDSLNDLLIRVPGVSKTRNMRIADGGKNYTDNRVDGMNMSRTGTFGFVDETNTENIERIEFITGPGSVLQSSRAIGGTINVITKSPPKVATYKLSQTVGSQDFYRTSFTGGNTFENGIGFIFNANALRDHGWRERDSMDKDSFSLKLAGKPTGRSSLSLGVEYLDEDALYPGQLTKAQFDQNWRQAQPGVYGRSQSTFLTPSVQYRQEIGERGQLTVGLSQRRNKSETWGNTSTYTSFSNKVGFSDETDTSFQAVFRQDFDFARGRLYLGLEEMQSKADSKTYKNAFSNAQGLAGMFAKGALDSAGSVNREKHQSPFVQYEFSPAERYRIHMGVRADDIEYEVDDRTPKNRDNKESFSKFVPKIGATYDINPNNLVWVSYAEGFLAPSISTMLSSGIVGNTNNAGGNGYIPAANLKPEEMKTYELGFRGFLTDKRLSYDVTLYHTQVSNMVLARDCSAAEKASIGCYRINENVGSITAQGLEAGLSLAATSWLDLGLSYTLAYTKFDEYKTTSADQSGKSYNSTPRHHLNTRLTFKPMPGLKSELEADYESRYYLDHMNTASYSRPVLVNLRTSYTTTDKRWSFWLHMLNLTDVKYARRMSLSSAGIRTYTDGYFPFTLRAGVSYNF